MNFHISSVRVYCDIIEATAQGTDYKEWSVKLHVSSMAEKAPLPNYSSTAFVSGGAETGTVASL